MDTLTQVSLASPKTTATNQKPPNIWSGSTPFIEIKYNILCKNNKAHIMDFPSLKSCMLFIDIKYKKQ